VNPTHWRRFWDWQNICVQQQLDVIFPINTLFGRISKKRQDKKRRHHETRTFVSKICLLNLVHWSNPINNDLRLKTNSSPHRKFLRNRSLASLIVGTLKFRVWRGLCGFYAIIGLVPPLYFQWSLLYHFVNFQHEEEKNLSPCKIKFCSHIQKVPPSWQIILC